MVIYNVTLKVHHSIHDQWLKWLTDEHIPRVMNSGCFTKYQLVKLMEVDEDDGPTYAVQYYAASKKQYEDYIAYHANELRKESMDMWGDKFIAFRTLMDVII